MAPATGGQRNLGFAVRVKQFCCQPIDVERLIVARLQIDQAAPQAGVLDRNRSSQSPERRLDRIVCARPPFPATSVPEEMPSSPYSTLIFSSFANRSYFSESAWTTRAN